MGSTEGPPEDISSEAPFSNVSSQSDSSVTLSVDNSQQSSYQDSVLNSSLQNFANFSDSSLDDCYPHDESSLIDDAEDDSKFETWTDSFLDSDTSTSNSSGSSLATVGKETQESSQDSVLVENQAIAIDNASVSLLSNKACKLLFFT